MPEKSIEELFVRRQQAIDIAKATQEAEATARRTVGTPEAVERLHHERDITLTWWREALRKGPYQYGEIEIKPGTGEALPCLRLYSNALELRDKWGKSGRLFSDSSIYWYLQIDERRVLNGKKWVAIEDTLLLDQWPRIVDVVTASIVDARKH
ncbi:MAG: hypothetical protein ABIR91_01815 [Candidatus Saccharimonadales bacterium]